LQFLDIIELQNYADKRFGNQGSAGKLCRDFFSIPFQDILLTIKTTDRVLFAIRQNWFNVL